MQFIAKTDPGKQRDNNEDYYMLPVLDTISQVILDEKGYLFILCDGVGGTKAGEVASQTAAEDILKDYYKLSTPSPQKSLVDTIIKINTKIKQLSCQNDRYKGMATTLTALLIHQEQIHVCSVGDSRVYCLRQGTLTQLTEDQSHVWKYYKQGELSKDEIRFHPLNNVLTHALGSNELLHIHDIDQHKQECLIGDIYLMCSDGLTDMLSDKKVQQIMAQQIDLEDISNELIDSANRYGGKDNITLILVKI